MKPTDTMRDRAMPEELSTSGAAAELGISRPTLMTLIHQGKIKSHTVGTHTRVRRTDIVKYARAKESRIAAAVSGLLSLPY